MHFGILSKKVQGCTGPTEDCLSQTILHICMGRLHVNKLACLHAKLLQSCLTLCDPMNCSPPGSSVHRILLARILDWVVMPSSRGSSPPRDQTQVSMSPAFFFSLRCYEKYIYLLFILEANYFTILYWLCHTLTRILHRCIRVPHPEPSSHIPPYTILLGHPSAPAVSTLYHASNLDW